MSQLTDISVDYVDNELIITAFSNNGKPGWFSSTLAHFKGGNGRAQTFKFNPGSNGILPPGSYTLLLVGINWGGPSGFRGSVTIGGQTHNFNPNPTNETGVVFTQKYDFTV